MSNHRKRFRVAEKGRFDIACAPTNYGANGLTAEQAKSALKKEVKKFSKLQERLYASESHALLLIFQAMDAAGKDSTIRAVTSGVNPAGFKVTSFKSPSKEELSHDFLWRTTKALPERGTIGIFNRSHYEETLVVRVHPEYLNKQNIQNTSADIWSQRFEAIRNYEKHLSQNGTVILKFWLNVSQEEQFNRFEKRLTQGDKFWKFAAGDLVETTYWSQYMDAYQDMLRATSRSCAPWFAIPADDKPMMRLTVAKIINETLESLDLKFPEPPDAERIKIAQYLENLSALRKELTQESRG